MKHSERVDLAIRRLTSHALRPAPEGGPGDHCKLPFEEVLALLRVLGVTLETRVPARDGNTRYKAVRL